MPTVHHKYLIWDFDGTLAWRSGGWSSALIKVLHTSAPEIHATRTQARAFLQSGFPWHAPENAHPGLAPDEWWEDMQPVFARAFKGLGVVNGKAYTLASQVRPVYLERRAWKRFDDAIPALENLSARGWQHVLLTNHVPELPMLLERLHLTPYFAAVFNSAQTGYEKPNPKAFRAVQDWAGPGGKLYVIGDSFSCDIQGAKESNLPAILVRKPHPDAPLFCETLDQIAGKLH